MYKDDVAMLVNRQRGSVQVMLGIPMMSFYNIVKRCDPISTLINHPPINSWTKVRVSQLSMDKMRNMLLYIHFNM